jgi:hypothetical protein
MEDNIALVYMTLNMIYYYIYLIYMYHILLITSFNHPTEFKRLSFLVYSSSCENIFVSVVAPSPAPFSKESGHPHRHQRQYIVSFVSFFDRDLFQVHLISFCKIATNSLI